MYSLHRLEERLENCLIVSSNTIWYVMQFSLFVGKKKKVCILSCANEKSPLKLTLLILPSLTTPTAAFDKDLFLRIEKQFSFLFTSVAAGLLVSKYCSHTGEECCSLRCTMEEVSSETCEITHHVILGFILSGVSCQPSGKKQWKHRVVQSSITLL